MLCQFLSTSNTGLRYASVNAAATQSVNNWSDREPYAVHPQSDNTDADTSANRSVSNGSDCESVSAAPQYDATAADADALATRTVNNRCDFGSAATATVDTACLPADDVTTLGSVNEESGRSPGHAATPVDCSDCELYAVRPQSDATDADTFANRPADNGSDCESVSAAPQYDATDADAVATRTVNNGCDCGSAVTATVDTACLPADTVTALGSVNEESDCSPGRAATPVDAGTAYVDSTFVDTRAFFAKYPADTVTTFDFAGEASDCYDYYVTAATRSVNNKSDCESDAFATQSDSTDAFAARSVNNGSDCEPDATASVQTDCAPADPLLPLVLSTKSLAVAQRSSLPLCVLTM